MRVVAFASTLSAASPAQIPEPPKVVTIPPAALRVSVPNSKSTAVPLPAGSLDYALALLGLDACDYAKSYANGQPSGAVAMVGNPEIDCATWRLNEAPDVTVFSGSVTVDGAKLPIVAFYDSRDLAPSIPRRIVVEVIGGPGSDVSPGLNDYLPLFLVERGVLVIRIGYTGTRHGSSFPSPDLDNASFQVGSYAAKLRHLHPEAKIVLLGESLGGVISAKAAGELGAAAKLDGLALAIPLVFSGDDARQNFKALLSARNEQPHASPPLRLINSPRDPWSSGKVTSVSSLDLFSGFFPEGARHRNLESYLAQTKGLKKILAFGETDGWTGNAGIAAIARNLPDVEVIKLERNGHMVEKPVAQRLADSMWDLLLR